MYRLFTNNFKRKNYILVSSKTFEKMAIKNGLIKFQFLINLNIFI